MKLKDMYKNFIAILALVLLVSSCKKEHPKNYLSISGKFENVTEKDSTFLIAAFALRKFIKVNKDGTFKDSLKVISPKYHTIMFGGMRAYLHLENGYDLYFTGDRNDFFKSFQFEGDDEGAHSNQLIVDQFRFGQSIGSTKDFLRLEKESFLKKIKSVQTKMDSIRELYPNADKKVIENLNGQNESFFKNLTDNYDVMHDKVIAQEKAMARLKKGMPAPEFTDFENYKGGKNSLSDFKGKYVYIDVWATWCMPCIAEIPHLKKLQKKYEDKNIEFLSISTDDTNKTAKTWKEARKKWRKMVKDKSLDGVQLWAGKSNVSLEEDYMIYGIPRFILIDPEGKLISFNTMRPSESRLPELLDTLLQ